MMTDITNFSRIRVGNHYPQVLDISPINSHAEDGIKAAFTNYSDQPRVELRRSGQYYCLFLFRDPGPELPENWRDSELIWKLESPDV